MKQKLEEIRTQCVIHQKPTGVIQDTLMNLGMTLAEADVLINKWYEGLPSDWFDGGWNYLCTIRVSTEYDLKKLKDATKKAFSADLGWAVRYLSGCYEADLFYQSSAPSMKKED